MRKQMSDLESEEFIKEINSTYELNLVVEGIFFAKDEKRGAKKIFFFTGSHTPKVALEWIGQHFATISEKGIIDLSIEGAQSVGRTAKKTISLSETEAGDLFAGKDLETKEADGNYILKTGNDILCSAKVENKIILNPIPKSRRTRYQYQE